MLQILADITGLQHVTNFGRYYRIAACYEFWQILQDYSMLRILYFEYILWEYFSSVAASDKIKTPVNYRVVF
jgi:hypothetical protein